MRRRTTAVIAITSVLALTLATPAAAQEPPASLQSYAAGGSATALTLTLLGQELAVSNTSAAVSSGATAGAPEARANGAALLLAGTPVPGDAAVAAPGGPASNEACTAEVDLAALTGGALSALDLGLACVNTAATVDGGAPGAHSESGELVINVTSPAGTALEPVLTPLLDGVEQLTTPVLDALAPLLDPVEEITQIELDTILNDLIDNLRDELFVVAQIVVAPTATQAGATSEGVFARAGANGVTINVLPGLAATLADLGLGIAPSTAPLLSIQLGQAVAEVVRDPASGEARPDASAAQLLSIEASDPLGILQQLTGTLTGAVNDLAVDQLACDDANPLADILCVDLGQVRELTQADLAARGLDFGEGTVGREATAASIQLLPIVADTLGGSVIGLSLGSATAAANATPAAAPGPEVEDREESRQLPQTGGDAALPLTLALFAAAAAGLVVVRRTRTV